MVFRRGCFRTIAKYSHQVNSDVKSEGIADDIDSAVPEARAIRRLIAATPEGQLDLFTSKMKIRYIGMSKRKPDFIEFKLKKVCYIQTESAEVSRHGNVSRVRI